MDGKLIIVFIALASTPLASAAWIGFELADGSVIAPGNTVTINVIADLPCTSVEFGVVSDFGAGGAVVDQGTLGEDATYSSIMTSTTPSRGIVHNYNGVLFHESHWGYLASAEAGVPLVSFDYTINPEWDGVSNIIIAPLAVGTDYEYAPGLFDTAWHSSGGLHDGDSLVAVDIAGITIPEPGTVLLLGLGAMVVLRKPRS